METYIIGLLALHCALFGAGLARHLGRDALGWGIVFLCTGTIGIGVLWAMGRLPHSGDFDGNTTLMKHWQTLVDLDEDFAAASARLADAYGNGAVVELAERYLYLNDKQQLPALTQLVFDRHDPAERRKAYEARRRQG